MPLELKKRKTVAVDMELRNLSKEMASRGKIVKNEIQPDPLYESVVVSKFINHVMRKGKKSIARKILYQAFEEISKKKKGNPVEIFEKALENVSPSMEVRSRRIGGAIYQVPVVVSRERRSSLAMRWIISAARTRKGKTMESKLAEEIFNASENTGAAVKKKEEVHRMAESNKAFAHFAW
jgi:small subunit ribosomal protein S7